MPHQIDQLIKIFDLQPHPEGGYFKEAYRSAEQIAHPELPKRFTGPRVFSTAIYFLLPGGAKSHLHRIASDEVWHFYSGSPLIIVELFPNGRVQRTRLGQDIVAGQKFQHVVLQGNWFGAYPESQSAYSFVGCTVAPGFDFSDFEMASRSALIAQYPQARADVERLTNG